MEQQSNPKHAKLAAKTAALRAAFNLATQEFVIQDYRCALGQKKAKVFITQNYLFFYDARAAELSIAFRNVTEIKKDQKAMVVRTNKGEEFVFSSFMSLSKRDEALYLAQHLFEEPFTIIAENPYAPKDPEPGWVAGGNSSGSAPLLSVTAAPSPLVDLSSGRNALQTAQRTQQTAADTLQELERQARVLDGMHANVDRINSSLDRAERDLKSIESVGGALANKLTPEPADRRSKLVPSRSAVGARGGAAAAPAQRSAGPAAAPVAPSLIVPVVWKHANDTLEPARVRVLSDGCEVESCLVQGERRLLDRWQYDNVDAVKLRSRYLHLDIEFRDKREVQRLVNELALRCGARGRTLPVVFEKDSTVFPYNHEWIRGDVGVAAGPSPGSKRKTVGLDQGSLFSVPSKQSSAEHLLSAGAGDGVRVAFRMQDQQVDAISDAVKTLGLMAQDMGQEVDRQNDQIVAITRGMEETEARMQRTNQRITRNIEKL